MELRASRRCPLEHWLWAQHLGEVFPRGEGTQRQLSADFLLSFSNKGVSFVRWYLIVRNQQGSLQNKSAVQFATPVLLWHGLKMPALLQPVWGEGSGNSSLLLPLERNTLCIMLYKRNKAWLAQAILKDPLIFFLFTTFSDSRRFYRHEKCGTLGTQA